jgi:hypothetical protein
MLLYTITLNTYSRLGSGFALFTDAAGAPVTVANAAATSFKSNW